jgi:hypothetical protein
MVEGMRPLPNCQLACASKLVTLTVIDTCRSADVRFYASLPCLKSLKLGRLELDVDLSHLPCQWTRVEFNNYPSLMNGITALQVPNLAN